MTVKAKPEKNTEQMYEDGDFTGYLYASFVEPEVSAYRQQVYFASSNDGVHWDDLYYRVTKFEDMPSKWNCGTKVFMDVAEYPMGEYSRVETNLSEDAFDGVEGPGWFRYNKDDAERTGYKYCLMLDGRKSMSGLIKPISMTRR